MHQATLEERVARLENIVDQLVNGSARPHEPPSKDWRDTVGMFRGDPVMKEIIDGALRMREEERRQFRDQEPSETS